MTGLVDVRRLLRSCEGATAIEFALMAVPYFTLFLGIAEFSRVVWTQSALQFEAERTARYAAINESACGTEKLRTDAEKRMLAPGVLFTSFSCTRTPTCAKILISVTTDLALPLPYPLNPLTLRAESCRPLGG